MEPQFSVLLYSKYSPLSKEILDIIESSSVNLEQMTSLETLCIDNEKIRKRIHQNKQIDITCVPCILVIFPDGGIEKYDGVSAFEWIEEIIIRFDPPQPHQLPLQQQTPQQTAPSQPSLQQLQLDQKKKQKITVKRQKELVHSQREQERLSQKKKYESHLNKSDTVKNRRKISDITEEELEQSYTKIDDLQSEEELEPESEENDEKQDDRYRHRKPIGSIREDSGNYTRNDELFTGDKIDSRKAKKSAVKQPLDASQKKTVDLMTKAKEMEKGRQESNLPPGHPGRK